ncbi:hypothetical protein TPE_1783 [Treponema pedis str. T A4]|uniref:Uncharacterized protein n=1 Tax=Treponema pedis str. T A4 TaxID=1291379 RepID=S5ZNS7_9SPIR|nr:hypothetical protein TPE_1783 [Treponema pedis str. T A4]
MRLTRKLRIGHSLLLNLAPDGVYTAAIVTYLARRALTPPFHPYLTNGVCKAVYFLLHYP